MINNRDELSETSRFFFVSPRHRRRCFREARNYPIDLIFDANHTRKQAHRRVIFRNRFEVVCENARARAQKCKTKHVQYYGR